MEILKTTITNSVNESECISYYLIENEEQKQAIIDLKKAEVKDWNSPGPGKMSHRYLDVECTDLENATLQDLLGLPLIEVLKVFDRLKTTNPV